MKLGTSPNNERWRRPRRSIRQAAPWLIILAGLLATGGLRAAEPCFPPPESQGGWRKLERPEDIRRLTGMDPDKLAELKQWLLQSDQRDFAAVVIRNGYVVLEVERGNSAKTDSRDVKSVSKAICATVLAIASEQSQRGRTPRKMSFDDPAFDFIPWAQPLSDPRKAKITVKQLLNHTSGICPEALKPSSDKIWAAILGHTEDTAAAKLAFDPGTACGYSTHAFQHAALVCETVTGTPYDQFAIESLFKPIGCEHWTFGKVKGDEKTGQHSSHGVGLPARDLARIGYGMLREGRWGDKQVIPKWFVEETAKPTHDLTSREMRWDYNADMYSHAWELPARLAGTNENNRRGDGIPADARYKPGSGGQLIAFVPSLDLVITRQTGGSGQWPYDEYLRRACAAVTPETASPLPGHVLIGKGGADGVVAVGKDGVIHVIYGGKYRSGAAADNLSPAESITNLAPVSTVRMTIDLAGQPHVVFTTGVTKQATRSYYTARIGGRWLPAEKFADATDFAERTRAYVADVATDNQGQVLVSFWVSRPIEKRPEYENPSFYYRWRSPEGQWGPPLSLPAHWSSAPKVEYEPGRGFSLLWAVRGNHWRIAGPIAAGEKFTEGHSISTGSERLDGAGGWQNEGADFSRSADGRFVVAGNVREKFEGPVGVWAALGQGNAVSSARFLGSFPGTKRGDESSVHPVAVVDAATGATFITVMNPVDRRGYYAMHSNGSGWRLPYAPILPDHTTPQGNLRQGPSVADAPGPGVIALVRDGMEQWHLCPLVPPPVATDAPPINDGERRQ